ncbi:MAG: molybdate ABC transporter permease subunit [Pirellulales bacterium]
MSLSAGEWQAVWLSLQVSLVAMAASLPLGVAVAWLLARRKFYGKTLVETLVNLPLVVPPVVTGYALLVLFGRNGWLGRPLEDWFGLRFLFDWKGAALASAVMAFPLVVRSIRLAFSAVDEGLEQAARTLGARPLDAFCSITLPLAWPGLVAGAVLGFARGMGEFGATIMISGNIPGETRTLPLELYNLLETPGGADQAWRLVLVSVVLAAAAMFAGEVLERRYRERVLG